MVGLSAVTQRNKDECLPLPGGGVVQTADPDDLARPAAPYRTVAIEPLARGKGEPH